MKFNNIFFCNKHKTFAQKFFASTNINVICKLSIDSQTFTTTKYTWFTFQWVVGLHQDSMWLSKKIGEAETMRFNSRRQIVCYLERRISVFLMCFVMLHEQVSCAPKCVITKNEKETVSS